MTYVKPTDKKGVPISNSNPFPMKIVGGIPASSIADGSITTAKFAPDAKAPLAGTADAAAWDGITNKPTEFPPAAHTHTAAQISDASDVGRSVMTAADAAAARSAIGASDQNLQNMTLQEAQEGVLTSARAISPQVLRASMPNLSSIAMLNPGATLEEVAAKVNEIIQTISP